MLKFIAQLVKSKIKTFREAFVFIKNKGIIMVDKNKLYEKHLGSSSTIDILKLKDEIETQTDSKIIIKTGQMNIGANESLITNFENGTPTITISEGKIPTDEEIYHELYHLWIMSINGHYAIEIGLTLLNELKSKVNQIQLVLGKAHSIFHHSLFFDKMLHKGYQPTRYLIEQLDIYIDDYPNNCYSEDISIHTTLDVWHIMLGLEDSNLDTEKYLNIIKSRFVREYELGEKLIEISNEFSNPSDEPELFGKIMQKLFNTSIEIYYSTDNHKIIYNL